MHLLGYLRCRLIRMAQFYFNAGNESAVYPVFGGGAAGLADDGVQIALSEAQTAGIVAYLVVLCTVLGDELDKAVEDGLLSRTRSCLHVQLLTEQMVVVVHEGSYKSGDGGTMIILCVNHMPDGVENVAGRADIAFANRQLEVAYLTVEGRRHLTLCKGHGEIDKETDAKDAEVVGKTDGIDDGAWADVDQCASGDVTVLQIEVDMGLAIQNDAEAMVVDGEGRFLAHQQTEHGMISMNHTEFTVEEDVLADLCKMRGEYVPHARHVHQLGLLVHKPSILFAKIINLFELTLSFCINRTKRTSFYAER